MDHSPFSDFRFDRTSSDGKQRHISVSGVPVHDASGAFLGYRGTGRDITAQVEADQQLLAAKERAEQAEALLQDAIDSVPEGFVIYDRDDRLVMCNESHRARYRERSMRIEPGARYADILRQGLAEGLYVEAVGREEAWLAEWMRRHRESVGRGRACHLGRQVGAVHRRAYAERWCCRVADRHHRAEAGTGGAAQQRGASRSRSADRADWELGTRCTTGCYQWSKELYRIRGLPADGFQPTTESLTHYIHPEDQPMASIWLADLKEGIDRGSTEMRILRPDGEARLVSLEGRAVTGPDGEVCKLTGTMQDITERRLIEQQLVQAQKMEAVGNLTGGMAHDFNNLLGVIIGNLHLLSEAIVGKAEQEELCNDALGAARRGAELARRLLAFGRRQSLQPQSTDINHLVSETARLLTRMLGADVTVELELTKDLRPTIVDPVQLEAAITNLVSNARDAMPKGGRLTIGTFRRASRCRLRRAASGRCPRPL